MLNKYRLLVGTNMLLLAACADASMGTIGNTFGLLPNDVASAQANSIFSSNASASYYNPAGLAQTKDTQLNPGYLYVSPELRIKSQGGSNPPIRIGDVADDEKNNNVILGLKLYLNNISPQEHNISWGLIVGLEDDGRTFLDIEDETSQSGQFMQYGEKPAFISTGFGMEVMEGLYLGLGSRLNVAATAPVVVESDLAGVTSNERVNVQASTTFSDILGVLVDFGKMFCAVKDKKLCVPGLKLAFAYREESYYSLGLNANAVIPGTINPPGLDLIVYALDAYHPDIITLGLQYPFAKDWTVDFTYEKQTWSQLTSQLESKAGSNAVKDQGNLAFDDISIPRVAFTYRGFEGFAVRDKDKLDFIFGLAFEDSALKDGLSPDVNMIDNDRTVYSFGVLYTVGGESKFLNQDMSIEFAYQYHVLDDREFQMSTSAAPTLPFETVSADGEASVLSFGVNVRF